ncbi:hypothetical protein Rhe02_49350 [Rhizocola hellebori]|uniref:Uncharacterized protein n=1 Tax=Rhizocola hellebori TaxID=1392758 RepID=A0A8J3VIF1_9ACTN|nr:hypothetical protein [Rhizocola hellebori]GIH06868.1 hypothetical protein Rhe02_49350 [Rhizocola hellebori]
MSDLFTRLVSGPVSRTTPIVRGPMHTEAAPLEEHVEETTVNPPAPALSPPSPAVLSFAAPAEPHAQTHSDPARPAPPAAATISPSPQAIAAPPARSAPPSAAPVAVPPVLRPAEREVVVKMLSTLDSEVVERVRPVTPIEHRREPRPAPQPPERQTVQISIGRIEIRAPQAPSAAPAPVFEPSPVAAASDGVSLSDYLRGNDGRPR